MVDFNFSAAPLSSEPSSILLMFKNTGSIPVEWLVFITTMTKFHTFGIKELWNKLMERNYKLVCLAEAAFIAFLQADG